MVMFGHRGPEIERLLPGGVISRRRIKFRSSTEEFPPVQIADAVPVNDDIQSLFICPRNALVEQLEVIFFSMDAPRCRMYGNPHDICAPGPGHFEIMSVPFA